MKEITSRCSIPATRSTKKRAIDWNCNPNLHKEQSSNAHVKIHANEISPGVVAAVLRGDRIAGGRPECSRYALLPGLAEATRQCSLIKQRSRGEASGRAHGEYPQTIQRS